MLLDEKGGASDCGEAVVRTPAMMEGYYERPDLTREVLQDGWLRTGDVFARDEQGLYYFKARVKDVIKTGGENVYASRGAGGYPEPPRSAGLRRERCS